MQGAKPAGRGAAVQGEAVSMMASFIGFARETRTGVRTVVVVIVMSVLVATLSHIVFTPWNFEPYSLEDPQRAAIPRVAIKP